MATTTARPTVAPPPPREIHLTPRRLNVLRVGYLVMGVGLAVYKWPALFDHQRPELYEGTVECLLVAMSVLALRVRRFVTASGDAWRT